jgi:hypothetical protein
MLMGAYGFSSGNAEDVCRSDNNYFLFKNILK